MKIAGSNPASAPNSFFLLYNFGECCNTLFVKAKTTQQTRFLKLPRDGQGRVITESRYLDQLKNLLIQLPRSIQSSELLHHHDDRTDLLGIRQSIGRLINRQQSRVDRILMSKE